MAACGICFEGYDSETRPPVLAPCGHTLCGRCVTNISRTCHVCPFCRTSIPEDEVLPRNYALLEVMDAEQAEGTEKRLLRQYGVLPPSASDSNGDSAAGQLPSALVLPAEELELTTQELGVGGSGRVVLGRLGGREVAVKLMALSGSPPAAQEALRREVQLLARVSASCRHTVKLLGISVKEGRLALVMRRYPACLTGHLQRREGGCLTHGSALLLAQDLLRGLAELHMLGVVMADLKPDNVLMDESGVPLLSDFGLSRAVSTTTGQHLGQITSAAGSINYMAPEQFAVSEGGRLTPQSDMWGLGCTLLHALTGRPPWAGMNMGQITIQVGMNRKAPPLPPSLPPALQELLGTCLQPDPERRPSAAVALAVLVQDLEMQLNGALMMQPSPLQKAAAAAPPRPWLQANPLQDRSGGSAEDGAVVQPRTPEPSLDTDLPPLQLRLQRPLSSAGTDAIPPAGLPPPPPPPPQQRQDGSAGQRRRHEGLQKLRRQMVGVQQRLAHAAAEGPTEVSHSRRLMPVDVYLADPSTLLVQKRLVRFNLPVVDCKPCCGEGAEAWEARLELDTLQAALLDQLDDVPQPHQRYLLRSPDSHRELKEVAAEAMQGEGLQLGLVVDGGNDSDENLPTHEIYVLDKRVPKLRVDVVLLGQAGACRAVGVEVDAATSSTQLGERAASNLPEGVQLGSRFELLLDGVRRRFPCLLDAANLFPRLGLVPAGECVMLAPGVCGTDGQQMTINVKEPTGGEYCVPVVEDMLVEELKEQLHELTGISVGAMAFISNDKQMVDGDTLKDYGVSDGDTVDLIKK